MITEKEAIDILKNPDEVYHDIDGLVGYTYNPRKRNYEAFQLAIKGLERLKEQTRWIPVSEKPPKVGEKVLCKCQANIYEVLKLTENGWYHDQNHCYMYSFVIAWQPLPD